MKRILIINFVLIILFISSNSSFGTNSSDTNVQKGKTLKNKNIVMVIAPKNFRDEELLKPLIYFKEKGANVLIASNTKRVCIGMLGAEIYPDILIDDIDTSTLDAIVLVGGIGAKTYWNNKKVYYLLRELYSRDKLVSAICLAPVTLAKAGLLKNKKATVWKSEGDTLKKYGAIYTAAPVSVSGNIVTGNGPLASDLFAAVIEKKLMNKGASK